MVSYLTTLFLGIPVLMPILSPVTGQLALLKSAEEGTGFPRKNVSEQRIDCRTAACEVDTLQTKLPPSQRVSKVRLQDSN